MDSTLDLLPKVVEMLVRFIDEHYSNLNLFEYRLAFFESLANAVKHGNSRNPALQVKIQVQIEEDTVLVSIEDQGTGFDWQEALEHRSIQTKAFSGRGLQLLLAYNFNPSYNETGNILYLKKYITT